LVKGNLDCVKILLGYHANVKAVNGCGNTAVHLAARMGKKECLETLLQTGTNKNISCGVYFQVECPVNQLNAKKESPLHLATEQNHANCVSLLLSHNAQDSQNIEVTHHNLQVLILRDLLAYI
jgi:ankyrin